MNVKKIIVIGDPSVGKTAVLMNYVDGVSAIETISTIGIDFKNKNVNVDGNEIKLQLWDTAGQEQYRTIATAYYKRAHGIALFYDVTSRQSYEHIPGWMESITSNTDENIPIVLIGNKIDLESTVTAEAGQEMANEYSVPFFLTSAVTGQNIEEAFLTLARMMISAPDKNENNQCIEIGGTREVQDLKTCKC